MNTVENIQALKAFINMTDGTIVYVKGYFEANDGGGSFFNWNGTSTLTANDGTIFQANNSQTGRWLRIFDGDYNVRWFGVTGESAYSNIQNQTDRINAAITHISGPQQNIGGVLYFPPGVYAAIEIKLKSCVTLMGAGIRASFLIQTITQGNKHFIELADKNVHFTRISGFTIDGNFHQPDSNLNDAIHYDNDGADNLPFADTFHTLDDLHIIHATGSGVYMSLRTRESKLYNVFVTGAHKYGFELYCTDSIFTACVAGASGLSGFYCDAANSRFIGCKAFGSGSISKVGTHGCGFEVRYGRQILSACEAQENANHGFLFYNPNRINGIVVSGCLADSNGNQGFRIDNVEYSQFLGLEVIDTLTLVFKHSVGVALTSSTYKNHVDAIIRIDSPQKVEIFGQNTVKWTAN